MKSVDVLLKIGNILFPPIETIEESDKTFYIDRRIDSAIDAIIEDYKGKVPYDKVTISAVQDVMKRLEEIETLLKEYLSNSDSDIHNGFLVVAPKNT